MSKKLLLILFAILLGAAQPLEAQRRNPAKNADTAFERGQYSIAIERYKKALKKVKKKIICHQNTSAPCSSHWEAQIGSKVLTSSLMLSIITPWI